MGGLYSAHRTPHGVFPDLLILVENLIEKGSALTGVYYIYLVITILLTVINS